MTVPARRAKFDAGTAHRRGLTAKIHIAQKQLGLSEDDYRAVLLRVAGLDSTKDMTVPELEKVLAEFTRQGFRATAKPGAGAKPADHPFARKARALWISIHQIDPKVVRNPSEQALEAFAQKMLKVARMQWANEQLAYRLIEALKAMAERAGWSQDLAGVKPHATVWVLKRRLVELLFGKLRTTGLISSTWTIAEAARRLGALEEDVFVLAMNVEQLDLVARTFAKKLREPIPPVSALELVR